MKLRKSILIAIVAVMVAGIWIATRPAPDTPAPPVAADAPKPGPILVPPAGSVEVEPEELPETAAIDPEPAAPRPRTEESRASSRRNFENPLVESYPPGMPPPRPAEIDNPELAAEFEKIHLMLREYRALTGENPVGTNREIMKALMGENPKGARFGPPEGQSLNENGELIDRWGTPYFFHQMTKDWMEIRSAGPDRRMWNEDDLSGS